MEILYLSWSERKVVKNLAIDHSPRFNAPRATTPHVEKEDFIPTWKKLKKICTFKRIAHYSLLVRTLSVNTSLIKFFS